VTLKTRVMMLKIQKSAFTVFFNQINAALVRLSKTLKTFTNPKPLNISVYIVGMYQYDIFWRNR